MNESNDNKLIEPVSAADDWKNSGFYDADRVSQLESQLAALNTDDAALRAEAEADYNPVYQNQLQNLRHELDLQTQAYGSQMQAADAAYERQKRAANQSYDLSASRLSNALTARGLGRSSLVSTQGAQLEKARNQALGDIEADRTAQINALNDKIALLTAQTAQKERTLADTYAQQLESRINALKQSRQTASVSLQLQIAALQQQGYEAYQNWLLKERDQTLDEAEFRQKYGVNVDGTPIARASGSSHSSGGKSSKTTASSSTAAAKTSSTNAAAAATLVNTLGSLVSGLANKVKSALTTPAKSAKSTGSTSSASTTGTNKFARRIE